MAVSNDIFDIFSSVNNGINAIGKTVSTEKVNHKPEYEKLKYDLTEITSLLGDAVKNLNLASSGLASSFTIDGKSIDKNDKLYDMRGTLRKYINDINNVVIARDIAKKLK